jgi:hypothetical protein
MATKRQKKLERKKQKRSEKRRDLHKAQSAGLATQMQRASSAHIHECLMSSGIVEDGIGHVVFSRKGDGQISAAVFLVDVYCLGVKDAFGGMMTLKDYQRFKEQLGGSGHDVAAIDAPSARRLVERAVDYARSIGFSPVADYRKLAPLFGDVNPDDGRDLCEFGQDGKPLYVAGPYDSPTRSRQIIKTLIRTCGLAGFDYVVPGGAIDPCELLPSDDSWEEEEDSSPGLEDIDENDADENE